MVAGFIFFLHIVLVVFAFIKYKKESIGEGFLAVAFVGIVFAVGWTIAAILTNLLFTPEWFIKWYWQPLEFLGMGKNQKRNQPRYNFSFISHSYGNCILLLLHSIRTQAGQRKEKRNRHSNYFSLKENVIMQDCSTCGREDPSGSNFQKRTAFIAASSKRRFAFCSG